MKKHWPLRIAQLLVVLLVVIAGFGEAVLQLWNHLMPQIFKLPEIGFWQAVGLMALAWILFGSWRGGRGLGGAWRHRMREKWEAMTPEQREQFRRAMHHGAPPPQPQA